MSDPHDLGRPFAGTLGDRFSIKDDTAYWASVVDKLVSGKIKEFNRGSNLMSGDHRQHGRRERQLVASAGRTGR